MKYFIAYLVLINIAAFIIYGADKHKAKKGQWRIPEKTLIGVAVLGGSIGAVMGMRLFRHKTKHPKFYIGIPVIILLQIAVVVVYYFLR